MVSQPAGIETVDVDVVGVVAEALLGVALPGVVTAAEAEEAETEELTVPGLVELAAVVVVVAAVATVVARLAADQGTAVVVRRVRLGRARLRGRGGGAAHFELQTSGWLPARTVSVGNQKFLKSE